MTKASVLFVRILNASKMENVYHFQMGIVERKQMENAKPFQMFNKSAAKNQEKKVNVWPNVQLGKAMMLMTKTKKENVKHVMCPNPMDPISKANVKQNHYAQHPNAYKMENV